MFKINDMIVYGTEGVCLIEGIETKMIEGASKEYYVLKPVDGRKSTIYIPTKNQKLLTKMRKISSKREIITLIDSISDIEPQWIRNETERKAVYKRILADGDRTALIMMMKALYLHQKEQESKKKHLHMADERFLRDAEQLLYNEWQYVLDMDRGELMAYIYAKIEK